MAAAGVEMRLEAVPEMGYDPAAEPPTGEVCIRGPGLFSGYYKQPELTKECMGEQAALSS
jgi:long-chain acyl-CoA synthetase